MTPLVWLLLVFATAAACGIAAGPAPEVCLRVATAGAGLAIVAARVGWGGHRRAGMLVAGVAAALAGVGLGGAAEARAWTPEGVNLPRLEAQVGGGAPVRFVGTIVRDAARTATDAVAVDVRVHRVQADGAWVSTALGMRVLVTGGQALDAYGAWTRGRTIEAPVSAWRRPLPYRNFGVPDAERALARQGVRVFATVKSAALVSVAVPGPPWQDAAAAVRRHVRRTVARHVRDPAAAAVVTAILIGDRSRMAPADVRALQHAGVYHVVAISGGNVGVWIALLMLLPRAGGLGVRVAMVWLLLGVLLFAAVVDGGASVSRAVTVAVVAIAVRWWDLRAAGLQVLAVAAWVQLLLDPLVLHDPGWLLSFAAAGTLVGVAGRRVDDRTASSATPWRPLLARALVGGIAATAVIEAVVLPIAARWFHVATAAGVLANVVAVPAMALVQVAGLAIIPVASLWPALGDGAGSVAASGVHILLASTVIVSLAPWLVREVPAPSLPVLASYAAALTSCGVCAVQRRRGGSRGAAGGPGADRARLAWTAATGASGTVAVALLAWIVSGGLERADPAPWTWRAADAWQRASWPREPWLLLTVLDVGQGDATVVRFPSGTTWLVDAGGSVSETFDVGERVTTPALWALGHRHLARLVVTHAHPDHVGGMPAVVRRLGARELLTGVPVVGGDAADPMRAIARERGIPERRLAAGESFADGPVHVAVLHPERPDWERRRVRNDDSVVLWIRMGDVGILLPGDVGEAVEARCAAHVAAAPISVVRLAHHGSTSSTGRALLAHLRPVLAIASLGRANRFGHPAPAVLRRLDAVDAVVLRTDQDGAVQLATNGRVLLVRTAAGRAGGLTAATPRRAWWPATPPPSDPATRRPASARRPRSGAPPPGTGG